MQIRSGQVYVDINSSAYNLHKGTGVRLYTIYVKFKVPFENIPEVMIGLNILDIDKNYNARIKCYAQDITQTGFNMCFKTWGDSIIYAASTNWIAYGEE